MSASNVWHRKMEKSFWMKKLVLQCKMYMQVAFWTRFHEQFMLIYKFIVMNKMFMDIYEPIVMNKVSH